MIIHSRTAVVFTRIFDDVQLHLVTRWSCTGRSLAPDLPRKDLVGKFYELRSSRVRSGLKPPPVSARISIRWRWATVRTFGNVIFQKNNIAATPYQTPFPQSPKPPPPFQIVGRKSKKLYQTPFPPSPKPPPQTYLQKLMDEFDETHFFR